MPALSLTPAAVARPGGARRGRPAGLRWLSPGQVSAVLGLSGDRVMALLAHDFFPGARQLPGRPWEIPIAAVRSLLGVEDHEKLRLQRWMSLPTLARLLDGSVRTLERWRKEGRLLAREIRQGKISLGWRVPESEYWRLVGLNEALAGLRLREMGEALRAPGRAAVGDSGRVSFFSGDADDAGGDP